VLFKWDKKTGLRHGCTPWGISAQDATEWDNKTGFWRPGFIGFRFRPETYPLGDSLLTSSFCFFWHALTSTPLLFELGPVEQKNRSILRPPARQSV
jgi:hypothetical protein